MARFDTYYYSLGGRLLGSLDSNGTQFYLTDALGSLVSAFTNAAGGAALKGNQLFGPYGSARYTAGSINTAKGFLPDHLYRRTAHLLLLPAPFLDLPALTFIPFPFDLQQPHICPIDERRID